jgi:hypothetical protein
MSIDLLLSRDHNAFIVSWFAADSGGNVNVVVTSTKEVKVGAVRQAFQTVFGRATVFGVVM